MRFYPELHLPFAALPPRGMRFSTPANESIAPLSDTVNHQVFSGLVARSESMQQCIAQLLQAAGHTQPIWLLGAQGTGRHRLAHCMHLSSKRSNGPFVRLRCREMVGSALQRAILGNAEQPSLLHRAMGGTLYIEDAEHLSPWEHALLADLMSERLHASHEALQLPRLILSSSVDLRNRMTDWYWLQQLFQVTVPRPILIPSLQQRKQDLHPLAECMLHHLQQKGMQATSRIRHFSPDAAEWINNQEWHGNLVEMRDCLRLGIERKTAEGSSAGWLEPHHLAKPKPTLFRLLKRRPSQRS